MRVLSVILCAGLLLAGCSTLEPPLPLIDESEVGLADRPVVANRAIIGDDGEVVTLGSIPTLLDLFRENRQESAGDRSDATKAAALLEAGVSVVATRCDLYFRRLGTGARDGRLLDRQLVLLEGALVAALALADTPDAETIASVPLLSGLFRATNNNVADGYLFSPDIHGVRDLTMKAISTAEVEFTSGRAAVRTYHDALDGIRAAQDICTVHSIRNLVDGAIAAGQITARYNTDSNPFSPASPLAVAKQEIGQALGGVILSDEQIVVVYWHIQGVDPANRAEACTSLPPRAAEKLCSAGAPKTTLDSALHRDLLDGLKALEDAEPGWLAKALEDYRATLAGVERPTVTTPLSPLLVPRPAFTLGVN